MDYQKLKLRVCFEDFNLKEVYILLAQQWMQVNVCFDDKLDIVYAEILKRLNIFNLNPECIHISLNDFLLLPSEDIKILNDGDLLTVRFCPVQQCLFKLKYFSTLTPKNSNIMYAEFGKQGFSNGGLAEKNTPLFKNDDQGNNNTKYCNILKLSSFSDIHSHSSIKSNHRKTINNIPYQNEETSNGENVKLQQNKITEAKEKGSEIIVSSYPEIKIHSPYISSDLSPISKNNASIIASNTVNTSGLDNLNSSNTNHIDTDKTGNENKMLINAPKRKRKRLQNKLLNVKNYSLENFQKYSKNGLTHKNYVARGNKIPGNKHIRFDSDEDIQETDKNIIGETNNVILSDEDIQETDKNIIGETNNVILSQDKQEIDLSGTECKKINCASTPNEDFCNLFHLRSQSKTPVFTRFSNNKYFERHYNDEIKKKSAKNDKQHNISTLYFNCKKSPIASNLNSNFICTKEENMGRLEYDMIPTMKIFPVVGNIIAFKILELSEDYSPEISDFKKGKVVNFNLSDKNVTIELLENLKRRRNLGKFDLQSDDTSEYSEKIITVKWTDIIEPKLLY